MRAESAVRWTKVAFAAMAATFALHGVLFFQRTATSFVHSDAATEVLLTVLTMEAKSPLVSNFYYVNGDYWIFGAQWLAAPIILVLGVTVEALLATNALALLLELGAFAWIFRKLGASRLQAAFGAIVTLFSWSAVHLLFEYVELSYAMITACHTVVFVVYARAMARKRQRDAAFAISLFFVLAAQNPVRTLGYALIPLVAGFLWRWEPVLARRWRVRVAGLTIASWALAWILHRFVLRALVTPAVQAGMGVSPRSPLGMVQNVGRIARGFWVLAEPRADWPWTGVLGVVVMGGAAFWVVRFARASRACEPARFVAIVLLAEASFTLCLFLFGDILSTPMTVRYIMPALLPLLGLGCILAMREAVAEGDARRRTLAVAWLCLLPLDASIATSRRVSGAREVFAEADPLRLQHVADELSRRRLHHGFATYWNANSVTLLSGGTTKTCGIAFRDQHGLVPRKWLVDTRCFRAAELPASIYLIAAPGEHDAATAATATLAFPAPIDRFAVDDFDVRVYRTADCPLAWLDLARPRL